jgi:hypothetical protein
MKTKITFLLFSFFSFASLAQTDDYYVPAKPKLQDRVSGSIMAGTGVSFMGNSGNTAVSTFIAPKFNFRVSPKFSVSAGLMHYTLSPQSAFTLSNTESLRNGYNRPVSGNLVFVGGEYQLSKKVMLAGAVMTDMNSMNKRNGYKAVSFGMDYKVAEHASIGFRATVSQGSGDYNYDPKRGTYNYNPFMNNPAGLIGGFGEWSTNELNRVIR